MGKGLAGAHLDQENASGLGYLLAQELVDAGERAVDVQPKLAALARLLDNGDVGKDDPDDARSVAVAAMRAKRLAEVAKEDHTAVMKLWARRRKFLTISRTRVANRLHAVILELVPGGYMGEIYANKVERLLESWSPPARSPMQGRSSPLSSWPTSAGWTPSWPRCVSAWRRSWPHLVPPHQELRGRTCRGRHHPRDDR